MSVLGTATMFNQNEYVFVLINSQKITTSTINANTGFFSTIYAQNIGGTVNISNIRAGDISSITGYIASLTATQASINSLTSTDINTSTITAKYIELYEDPGASALSWNSATTYVPNSYVLYSNIRYVTPRFNLNVAPNVPIPLWVNNTPYLENNYAFVAGVGTYRSKSNTPGSAFPPNGDPQGWDYAFGGNNQSNVWQTSPTIYSGIVGDNNSYINVGNANVSSITAKYIELYNDPSASAPLWNSNVNYGITEYVSYSNIKYVSVRSNLNINPSEPIPGWVNNTPYLVNNYAFVAGVGTYRCISNTPGAVFPPNGDPLFWAPAFLGDDQTNIWQTASPIYSGIVGDTNSYINVGNANISNIRAGDISSITGYIEYLTTTGYLTATQASINSLTSIDINTSTITAKYIEVYKDPVPNPPLWDYATQYVPNSYVLYSNIRYVTPRFNINVVPDAPIPLWLSNTPYLLNNYAFVAGLGSYRCKTNTPGSVFPPNIDPQGWDFSFGGNNGSSVWQTSPTIYSGIVGDNNSYITVGNANVSSITAKYIELYKYPGASPSLWNSNVNYGITNYVSYNNIDYVSVRGNLNINPSEPIPGWVNNTPYLVNNYAFVAGVGTYRCKSNTPGSVDYPNVDILHWDFAFLGYDQTNIWQTTSPNYSGIVGDSNSYINVGNANVSTINAINLSSLTGYISTLTVDNIDIDNIELTTASISFLTSCNIITSSITSAIINASTINSKNIELYSPSLWNSNIDYRTNDVVTYSNQQYQALRDNLNINPSEPIPEWLANTPYKKNNYAYVISVATYKCLADTPGNSFPPNSDPEGWVSAFINNNQSNIWQPIPNIRSGIVGDSNSYINIGTISSLTGYISSFTTDHISSQTASISSLRSSDISSLTGYISSFTTDHISSQTASISSIFSQSLTVSSLQATFGFFSNLMATVANFSSISVSSITISSILNSNLHLNDLTVNNLYSSNIYNGGDIFAQDITSVNFTNSNEFTNIGDTTLNKLTTNGLLTANNALITNGTQSVNNSLNLATADTNNNINGTTTNVAIVIPPFGIVRYYNSINNIKNLQCEKITIIGGATGTNQGTILTPPYRNYSIIDVGQNIFTPGIVTIYGLNPNPAFPLTNLTTALSVQGDTTLTGNTSFYPLNGTLTAFTAYGNAYVTGTFNVTGLMTALGAVVLTGTTNCLANLNVALLLTVTGITSLVGGCVITGVFSVQNATINFNNQVGGSAYTFYNYGSTVLNNGLTLNGDGNANNNFGVGGNLNVNGNTTLGGTLTTANITLEPYVPPTFPGWSESVVYNSNDKVTRTDLFYNALLTNLNTDPDGFIPNWESNVTYATFDIAQYSNSTFRATTSSSNVAPLPSNASWSFLFGGGDITNIWQLYNPPPEPSFITGDAISFISVGSITTSNATTSNLTVGNGSAVIGTPLYLEQNNLQSFQPTLVFKNNITNKTASIVFNSSEELLTTQACNITITSGQTASLLAGSNIYMKGISSIVMLSDDTFIFGNSNAAIFSEFGNVFVGGGIATTIASGSISIQSSCNIDIGASGNIFSQCEGELTLNSFSNTLISATGTIAIGAQGDAQFVSATGRCIIASGGSNDVEINAVGAGGNIIANTFGTGNILLYNGSNNGIGINQTGVNLGSDSNIDLTASNSIILNAPVVDIPGSNTVIQSISTLRLSTGTFFANTASFQSISTLSLSTGTLFANSISSINIQASNIFTSTLRATNTMTASTIAIDRIVGNASATNVFTNNLFPLSGGAQVGFGGALASGGYYNFLFGRSTFTTNINPATDGATTANNIKVAGHLSTVSLGVSTINFKQYPFISTLSNSIVTTTATIVSGTPGLTRLQSNALRFPFPGTYNVTQKYSISKGAGGGTHGCLIYDSNTASATSVADANNWSRMGMASVPFHDTAGVSSFTTAVTTILANSANLTRDLYYYDSGSGNYTASFYIAQPTIEYIPRPGILPEA